MVIPSNAIAVFSGGAEDGVILTGEDARAAIRSIVHLGDNTRGKVRSSRLTEAEAILGVGKAKPILLQLGVSHQALLDTTYLLADIDDDVYVFRPADESDHLVPSPPSSGAYRPEDFEPKATEPVLVFVGGGPDDGVIVSYFDAPEPPSIGTRATHWPVRFRRADLALEPPRSAGTIFHAYGVSPAQSSPATYEYRGAEGIFHVFSYVLDEAE